MKIDIAVVDGVGGVRIIVIIGSCTIIIGPAFSGSCILFLCRNVLFINWI